MFKQEELPGFLFVCNKETEPKCLRSGLFGLPIAKLGEMYKVWEILPRSLLRNFAGFRSMSLLIRFRRFALPAFLIACFNS